MTKQKPRHDIFSVLNVCALSPTFIRSEVESVEHLSLPPGEPAVGNKPQGSALPQPVGKIHADVARTKTP